MGMADRMPLPACTVEMRLGALDKMGAKSSRLLRQLEGKQ